MAHRTKVTAKKKAAFCKSLVETGGNVSKAALHVGIARQNCYRHKDDDPEFSQAWDEAVEEGTENLEQELYRRAHSGCMKPVYQGGKLVGHIQEYSDTLGIFLLKARKPEKYRERTQLQLSGDEENPVQFVMLPAPKGRNGNGNGDKRAKADRPKK